MTKPIRVLHTLDALSGSGSAKVITDYYRHVDRNRVQFDFSVYREPSKDETRKIAEMGGNVMSIPSVTSHPLAHIRDLWKVMRDGAYDVVHIHAGVFLSLPYLVLAKMAGTRIRVVHSHSAGTVLSSTLLSKTLRPISMLVVKALATELVACSPEAGEWVFGRALNRVSILPNAIDTGTFKFSQFDRRRVREELSLGEGPVAMFVGRLSPEKNPRFLAEVIVAAALLNGDYQFLIVGEGPSAPEVQGLIAPTVAANRTRFLGMRTDIPALMSAADVLLLPSLFEGFPMVLVEAQANGLPSIVSDAVTSSVALSDSVHFKPSDATPQAWARSLTSEAIPRSPGSLPPAYDLEVAAPKLVEFYERCLESGGEARRLRKSNSSRYCELSSPKSRSSPEHGLGVRWLTSKFQTSTEPWRQP